MSTIMWAQELQAAIKKSTSVAEKLDVEKDTESQTTRSNLQTISGTLQAALKGIWMGEDDGFFEIK
jgi:cohesin loading factor subunit SCC2